MKIRILIAGIMGALMLFSLLAAADYSGDQTLTQYERGMTYGDLVYVTVEDGSAYTTLDAGDPTDTMTQLLDISNEIPDGAEIITARLYNYVSWSTPDYRDFSQPGDPAEAKLTFNGVDIICQNPATFTNTIDYGNGVVQYWDTKGQGYSSIKYDCPSGTFAWDVTELVVDGQNTAIIANADSNPTVRSDGVAESFTTYGFGLLVVYNIEPVGSQPDKCQYWILEGADMLKGDNYYETPANATTSGSFIGSVPFYSQHEYSAELTTVVVSCDKGLNNIFFNGNDLGSCSLVNSKAIGVDTFDVTWDLLKNGNIVEIRDSGDYMVASNAFLVVEY